MPDALQCFASLVKILNKFGNISVGYVQKAIQKQPKIVLYLKFPNSRTT